MDRNTLSKWVQRLIFGFGVFVALLAINLALAGGDIEPQLLHDALDLLINSLEGLIETTSSQGS